jgi:hypothetical protein
MADNQEQSQGNIKTDYNVAQTGLNMDQTLNQVKKGQLTYALNASVENFDASSVNYQNEPGNEFCLTFPDEYVLIGDYFIQEKNKHIFFITNPNTGDSEIGYMDNNDCQYKTLVNAKCLNFNINYPIHKTAHKITNCTTEIYWTDGYNSRRYLDIENIPYLLKPNADLCNPEYTNQLDCNQLKLQPNFSIPLLNVSDITTGGDLTAGTYQFAIQYSDPAGNPYTSYYSVTNPTPIADISLATVNFNYQVGKSIIIDVNNLDVTGQFQYFNLAVIKTINNITSVELVGTYFIEEANNKITYTGQIVDNIRLSINDIFEKFPHYELADDLTAVQDVLVWKGLTSIDRVNYQSIASQISLQWVTYKIPASENYADELNATNLRGYLRDEVYAFEFVPILASGKQMDGFHIPGRIANSSDLFPVYKNTNDDFIGDELQAPTWQIYNTASVIGDALGENIGNATPYQYGEFAYWESTEEYPCNTNVWGELAGQKIRHHKFPDVLVSPINETAIFSTLNTATMGNTAVFPIGVKIDTQQVISLIQSSSLTAEQKADIVGYKIVRGDRSTNKSIVGKGILRNVNEYKREEQTFYFPNYPYNDLNEDAFLNSNNNAWAQICETWLLYIRFLNDDPNGGAPFVEIDYVDCNTNKSSRQKFYTLGEIEFCAIGKPIFIGETTRVNTGFPFPTIIRNEIGYANYDGWLIASTGVCRGWRAEYNDAINGITTQWLGGFGGSTRSFEIQVVVGSAPTCIEYCDRCGITIERRPGKDRRSTIKCNESTSLPGLNTNLAKRQVFNSPETSFGQPFLGNVLKLENVIFGKGQAHFVQVKDNAKYRLLTKEAQRDALDSSSRLGNISSPFSAAAMFATYQAYLTIYLNGITRKNYAYSYNSIADYNYNVSVPNNGFKQRMLDIKKYLIPAVQNVGDTHNINNFQRESSVFLKTKELLSALPFPSASANMASIGITDKSRFTIGESNACATPAKEQDISVVSYYASLKNIFVNQWGQMYSYKTIDTGFQVDLNSSSQPTTIFGGDTFISRFTFKTKLPFFIDNRVNAPDDSDVFYDEIGNIAYPKFWHSARSILEDYSGNGSGVITNIVSYKAHNFDCPNSQLPAPPASNPNRTFYDGYFYLFAYGIPNFYCESSYNTDLRQAFNNREGDFWPHVSTGIPDDWVQESFVSIANDNTYNYNVTYSKQNKENFFSHLPPDWEDKLCFTNYPFRAIYSDLQNIDSDNRVNNWLIYRATSYFDFPQNYGNFISIDGIQNKAVLARFENKSLMYNNLLTLDTSNPQAAYLGNPSLFKGAPPIDFAETDLGYVGSQNKFLLKIPQGQITIDAKRGQIFLIEGTQAVDLTAFGSGVNRFMTDHLAFEILRYFPEINTDNHFNGIGIHGVYDSKFDRVIITKLDYIPQSNDVKYNKEDNEFYVETIINNTPIKTQVYLTDTDFFCNKSWTISFNFNTKSWTSFHSYIPNWYIGENNFFYSGINGCCTSFDGSIELLTGVVNRLITTTTTSTIPITTTTTSSTISPKCLLEGTAVATSCELVGTGIITVPSPTTTTTTTPCSRPPGLSTFGFFTGYQVDGESPVDSTGNLTDVCNAIAFTGSAFVTMFGFEVMTSSLSINSVVYNGLGISCTLAPDGWYFTDESQSDGIAYHVVGGVIVEIASCDCSTTTTTTNISPNIEECCGILLNTNDTVYYTTLENTILNTLNVPGFTSIYGIAMTANYLWSVTTSFLQWDITTTPFTATYNTAIPFPGTFTTSSGIVAISDSVIIAVDDSVTPPNIVELEIDNPIGPTSMTLSIQFALQTDRVAITNMLYTTEGKLIVVNQDTTSSDYYITQYNYSTGSIELDLNIESIVPTSIFQCDCIIYITTSLGIMYSIERTAPYSLVEVETITNLLLSATQIATCVTTGLLEITTTTTTTTV